ncbi:MAG: hypothetical protein AB7O52_05220 [Planctomycetota bacterium]
MFAEAQYDFVELQVSLAFVSNLTFRKGAVLVPDSGRPRERGAKLLLHVCHYQNVTYVML